MYPVSFITSFPFFQHTKSNANLSDSIMKKRKPRLSFDARDYDISSLAITDEEDAAIYKFNKLNDNQKEKENLNEDCKTDYPFIYQSI